MKEYTHCLPEEFVEGFEFEVKTSFTEWTKFTFKPGMLLEPNYRKGSVAIVDHYRWYPSLFRKLK